MIALNRRNAQWVYTGVRALYWLTYGLMISFASVYLQGRGFANREIGLILGSSYALSSLLQPVIANHLARRGAVERGICIVYGVIGALTALLLLAPVPRVVLLALVVCVFALQSALQPGVDTLAQRWTRMGCPVDFGKSRGVASLLYAGMTASMGLLLHRISPLALPAFYLTTIVLSICVIGRLKLPAAVESASVAVPKDSGAAGALLRSWRFLCFLVGVACLSLGHVLVDNFMLQIMQSFGGDSRNLGIAVSIASMIEVPAMLLHSRMSRRFGVYKLLILSGWAWFVKNVLIFLASSPTAIYAAEILQFFSYGLYIPTVVSYIAQILPPGERIRGQSFAGSAYTLGSVVATLAGGALLDFKGVHAALLAVVLISLLGAMLFSVSIRKKI